MSWERSTKFRGPSQGFYLATDKLQMATNWHQVYKAHGFLRILCQTVIFRLTNGVPKISPSFRPMNSSCSSSNRLASLGAPHAHGFIAFSFASTFGASHSGLEARKISLPYVFVPFHPAPIHRTTHYFQGPITQSAGFARYLQLSSKRLVFLRQLSCTSSQRGRIISASLRTFQTCILCRNRGSFFGVTKYPPPSQNSSPLSLFTRVFPHSSHSFVCNYTLLSLVPL